MLNRIGVIRSAWRLYQTEERADTLVALVLGAVAVWPVVREVVGGER